MSKAMIIILIASTVTFGCQIFGASQEDGKYVELPSMEDSSGDDAKNLITAPDEVIFRGILKQLGTGKLQSGLKKHYKDLVKRYLQDRKRLKSNELGSLTNYAVTELIQVLPVNLQLLDLDCKNLTNDLLEAILTRCKELQALGLSYCPKPSEKVISLIKENKNLKSLQLHKHNFTKEQLEKLMNSSENFVLSLDSHYQEKAVRRMQRALKEKYKKRIALEEDDDCCF